MTWYTRLKPPRPRSERERVARQCKRPIPQRLRKPPRIRDPDHIFYKTYSTAVYINGYRAKVITRYGIAKFFGITPQLVYKWQQLGVLPEPFIEQDRGQHVVTLYLSAQIRCLMVVVRDLVADGYSTMRWGSMPDHMEMLHNGYDYARDAFEKRLRGTASSQNGARRGVIFDDDE